MLNFKLHTDALIKFALGKYTKPTKIFFLYKNMLLTIIKWVNKNSYLCVALAKGQVLKWISIIVVYY